MKKLLSIITLLLCVCSGAWSADWTIALTNFTKTENTYEYTFSETKLKNYGKIYVEVPSASTSGDVSWKGSGDNNSRIVYIYKDNGTVKDETRGIAFSKNYNSVAYTSSDILTQDGKYYLVFSSTDDWKAVGVKYTATSSGDDPELTVSPTNVTLNVDDKQQITASATSGGTITYASTNTNVATVSNTGLISAVGIGNANITTSVAATGSYGMDSKTISVIVKPADLTITKYATFDNALASSPSGYFTISEKEGSSTQYNSKFAGTYAGTDYDNGLKFQDGTSLGFTTTSVCDLVIVQSLWSTQLIKIDGTNFATNYDTYSYYDDATNKVRVYTVKNLAAGTHAITRNSEFGMLYIGVTESLSPTLSVSPSSASSFTYITGNGPSATQTFAVTGSNLESEDITVSLQAGDSYYEISDDNTTFGTTDLTVASGDNVYVRLKAGLAVADSYAGTLRFASTGADNVDIALSGSVTNQVYTVTYDLNGGDGEAPTEDPQEAGAPITLPAAPTRDFYTFAGWLCSADGLVKTAGSSYTMTAANTTFTAQWTNPQYASSLDFTAVTLGGLTGSTDISDFLASANMVASNLGTGSGWDAQTAANKYGFWGYKLKNSGATVKFLVKAGKRVSIILGSVGDDATLKKGDASSTISKKKGDAEETVIPSFVAAEDMVVSITTGSAQSVTLKRIFIADEVASVSGTISASGWSTFSSEYPLDLSTISGGAAYYAKSTSGNNVTVTSTTDKVIAGEGLMIQGTPNAEFTIGVDAAATAAISDNLLRGVPVGGTVKSADHNYVFAWPSATPANYGFYLVNSTAPVMTAGKSFLHLSADLSNEAAFLSMIFDDEQTTGIESIHNSWLSQAAKPSAQFTIHTDAPTYNLSGQRVGESYKGIVIVNGRKFVRK